MLQLGDDAYAVPVRELIVTRAGRDVAGGALLHRVLESSMMGIAGIDPLVALRNE